MSNLVDETKKDHSENKSSDHKEHHSHSLTINKGYHLVNGIDYYYHIGFDSSNHLKKLFGDVKYVLLSGSAVRARDLIKKVQKALNIEMPYGMDLKPIGKTERYSIFKCGPIITASHGIGGPSLSILLHEITKLLVTAGVLDPIYIRIGTCGGIGIEPGTVVISTSTLNGQLQPFYTISILGKEVKRPTSLNADLANELYANRGDIPAVLGQTLGTDDFYEGQGRLDGAICEYTLKDKMEFLDQLYKMGVRNIEMESHCFAAFCNKVNIRCAVLCVALVNRLKGDQVTSTPKQLHDMSDNSLNLVLRFLQKKIGLDVTVNHVPRDLKENKDFQKAVALMESHSSVSKDELTHAKSKYCQAEGTKIF